MSNANDFVIENGVLKEYVGSDNDIVIPDSVTSIFSGAFSGCRNLTIHAPANSCAEAYAKENKIQFVAE